MNTSTVSAREIEQMSATQRHNAFINGAVFRLRAAIGGFESANRYVEAAARIGVLDERADAELWPRRGRLRRTLLQLIRGEVPEETKGCSQAGRKDSSDTDSRESAAERKGPNAHAAPAAGGGRPSSRKREGPRASRKGGRGVGVGAR